MSWNETNEALIRKDRYDFEDLKQIMRILRSEEGCPWDREQDHHSIRVCLIEETYEVAEAIDKEDTALLREELGDLLFQVVFHAQIEAEAKGFDMEDVIHDISAKMIHRHPHVFGKVEVENSQEVLQNWETIKTEEKQRNTLEEKLRAIPPMMPALMRASKVGKKTGRAEGRTPTEQLDVLEAELQSIRSALENGEDPKGSLGSFLMATTDLARLLGVDAEHALMQETDRIIDAVSKQKTT